MRTAAPLIANILIATGVYFLLTYFFFGSKEIGDAVRDALIFAVFYGAVQVAVRVYKARQQ